MLKFPQKKFKLSGKAQSGFFMDFFLKKMIDIFMSNFFIFGAMFFGEKYMIEKLTKKLVDSLMFKSNMLFGFTMLNYQLFFYGLLSIIFYFMMFLNFMMFFM